MSGGISTTTDWTRQAQALGFRRRGAGADDRLERDGFELRSVDGWLALIDRSGGDILGEGVVEGLRDTALWRCVRTDNRRERIFEVPPLVASDEAFDDTPDDPAMTHPLDSWLTWAVATARGAQPEKWIPPPESDARAWVAGNRLVARAGEHLARGRLECGPDRFGLVFSDIASLGDGASFARRRWVSEFCQSASDRWRLVRFGLEPESGGVRAEVDLSGVPLAFSRPLLELSAAALVCAVEWALPGLRIAADSGLESRVLDREPWWVAPTRPRRVVRRTDRGTHPTVRNRGQRPQGE